MEAWDIIVVGDGPAALRAPAAAAKAKAAASKKQGKQKQNGAE